MNSCRVSRGWVAQPAAVAQVRQRRALAALASTVTGNIRIHQCMCLVRQECEGTRQACILFVLLWPLQAMHAVLCRAAPCIPRLCSMEKWPWSARLRCTCSLRCALDAPFRSIEMNSELAHEPWVNAGQLDFVTHSYSACQSQIRPAHWSASAFWSRAMCAQGTHHPSCYARKKLFKCARVYHVTFVSLIFMPPLTTHIVLQTPTTGKLRTSRRNEGHRRTRCDGNVHRSTLQCTD